MKKTLLLAVLAVALFLGAVAYATAASQTISGNSPVSGSVTVTATVNPKINLTIVSPDATNTVNFGAVDPGVTSGVKTVGLSVDSNKVFSVSKTITGASSQLGLATTLANSTGNAKGSAVAFSDDYTITPPFTTDPGTYNAFVQYTVTQP